MARRKAEDGSGDPLAVVVLLLDGAGLEDRRRWGLDFAPRRG